MKTDSPLHTLLSHCRTRLLAGLRGASKRGKTGKMELVIERRWRMWIGALEEVLGVPHREITALQARKTTRQRRDGTPESDDDGVGLEPLATTPDLLAGEPSPLDAALPCEQLVSEPAPFYGDDFMVTHDPDSPDSDRGTACHSG